MQGKGLRALLIALAALALLTGCGGGGGEEVSSTSASASTEAQLPEQAQAEVGQGEERAPNERRQAEAGKQGQGAQPPHVAHHDSGGGSAPFRHPGEDNSIPEYGQEAGSPEREEAAESLHAYLDSLAAGRWEAACSYMSASLLATLERLPELSKQQADLEGCPEILAALNEESQQSSLEAAARADVASLRIEGDRGFLLYQGPGGEDIVMPMIREEGAWRVGSLGGTAGL